MDATFGTRELEVMGVLWDTGPATAAEVRASLDVSLAYTTIITILRNLEAKGLVEHAVEGRTHRFRAVIPKQAARRSAVRRLLDSLFHGSPEQLLTQLVTEHGLDAAEAARVAREARASSTSEGVTTKRATRRKR
jgi:BlaI family transcriptional regulator, penicillinase repressor